LREGFKKSFANVIVHGMEFLFSFVGLPLIHRE